MMNSKKITTVYAAEPKQGMTVGEVRAALLTGAPDDVIVKVTVNLRGGIRELRIIEEAE